MDKVSTIATTDSKPLIFPYRGVIWGATGVLVFLAARGTMVLFLGGVGLILAGEVLRIWGVGYIRNYRGPLEEAHILVTGGPYAYVRNPLYLANAVIGAGVALLSGVWWALLLFAGVYLVLYGRIVREEERYLSSRFLDSYREYAALVPRFIPRLNAYSQRQGCFSWRVIPEKEVHTLITLGLGILLMYLRNFTGLKAFLDRIFF